jgi:Regulator of chromosome condensation (RCC1) repeat
VVGVTPCQLPCPPEHRSRSRGVVEAENPDLRTHAAPDGTVTIMFSDIEGSTAMADRLGDGTNTGPQLCGVMNGCSQSPVAVSGLGSGVSAISANTQAGGFTCAVKDGGAWCWGDNNFGQLGDGTRTSSSAPVPVSGMGGP